MKTLVIIIVIAFACAAGVMAYLQFTKQAKIEQEIMDLKARKDQTLRLDSLRTKLETMIQDSLRVKLGRQDERIKSIEADLVKTRKQNAELQKLFDSYNPIMPNL